jgi:predicted kinase
MIMYILRGVPGAGKSTLAKTLVEPEYIFEADQYFENENGYVFLPDLLPFAHGQCYQYTREAMRNNVPKIVVSNTCTTEAELEKYIDLAREFSYTVFVMVVENRHGNESVHDVPEAKVEQMRKRLRNSISL